MKRRGIIMWIIGIIFFLLLSVIIWLWLPKSPLKSKFESIIKESISENNEKYNALEDEVYTEEDIKDLPIALQRFFNYSGFIGKQKIYNVHVIYGNTNFKLSRDKPAMKIKYQHYNFLHNLNRTALIYTSMVGIPFEGLDNYTNGKGSMIGMLGKSITLFDVVGPEMNASGLVTCLGESMAFLPTVALQNYVLWESIDNNTAKATIEYNGNTASGIFEFKDNGEMESFETNDRYMDEGNGKSSKQTWLIEVSDYVTENGMKHASRAKAIWKLDDGDNLYFDGSNINIEYNVKSY